MSKLPVPSSRLPQPFKHLPDNAMPPLGVFPRKIRRSKSVSDLRPPIKSNNLTTLKSLRTKPPPTTSKGKSASSTSIRPPINRVEQPSGTKRPASTKSVEGPSAPKLAKPAVWDYKTRYNQLLEKHKKLVDDFSTQQSDNSCIQHEVRKLRQDNIEYQQDAAKLTVKCADLEKANVILRADNSSVQVEVTKLRENNVKFQEDFTKLSEKYTVLEQENVSLRAELSSFKNTSTALQEELRSTQKELRTNQSHLQNAIAAIIQKDFQRRILHNNIQELKGNIRVFCRVRPPISLTENDRLQCNLTFVEDTHLEVRRSKESIKTVSGKSTDSKQDFAFDKVFPPQSTQGEVFEELAHLVQSALDGYNVCVFAYGQTGSGKTYTMQGEIQEEKQGMIPRSVDLIFSKISELALSGWEYEVEASFLEIYNETIRDLLHLDNKNLEIRYNQGQGTQVPNLTVKKIRSATELKENMIKAQKNRAVAATDFNEHSSRSHAVTTIYLRGVNATSEQCFKGSINLVDLAGSECAKTSHDDRITETKNINKSLSSLGSVMLALHNKDSHVPYRNSKLTYLLQSSLGGNSKTLMFVNISPFEENFGETINSLRFASKVKEVRTCAKRNKF